MTISPRSVLLVNLMINSSCAAGLSGALDVNERAGVAGRFDVPVRVEVAF